MLESLFSKQVVQPSLDKEFPLFKEAHDDRLFKHVTFLEEEADLKLRLTAVDHNYLKQTLISSTQKTVNTNLFLANPDTETFRIKAILSTDIDGVTESHWVQERRIETGYASSHNQYRIRGVSDKNFRGDWVYSELRDFENDLIVYNMIYDVLDLLLTVRDDQIDFLMDYMVSSTFAEIMKDLSPVISRSIDPEEFKAITSIESLIAKLSKSDSNVTEEFVSKLGEQFKLLASEMKSDFKENFITSPSEFTLLMRSYKLMERYKNNNADFVELLVESFLEDKYEKLVQKTDIEVLLQNEEEIANYINGSYELDIKAELIASISNASFDDHFVTTINDAVELLSEPIIIEQLSYGHSEEVEKFLRMVLRDIFIPMAALDEHLLEIHTDLEDALSGDKNDSIVEYMLLDDDNSVFKFLLLNDVINELVKGDTDLLLENHIDLLDYAMKHINDSRKSMLIDYYYDDAIKIIMNIGERFQNSYSKEFGTLNDAKKVSLVHSVASDYKKDNTNLKESYYSVLKESQTILDKHKSNKIQESKKAELLELIEAKFHLFKQSVSELIHSTMKDNISQEAKHVDKEFVEALNVLGIDKAFLEGIVKGFSKRESVQLSLDDINNHRYTLLDFFEKEKIQVYYEDGYYNLFKHYLRTPHKYPMLERKMVELSHDLKDYFFLDGSDQINLALGLIDSEIAVGTFKLGVNTMKGESV